MQGHVVQCYYEDLRPSLLYRFGYLGKVHVSDEKLQSLISNQHSYRAVATTGSEGWNRKILLRKRENAGEGK